MGNESRVSFPPSLRRFLVFLQMNTEVLSGQKILIGFIVFQVFQNDKTLSKSMILSKLVCHPPDLKKQGLFLEVFFWISITWIIQGHVGDQKSNLLFTASVNLFSCLTPKKALGKECQRRPLPHALKHDHVC